MDQDELLGEVRAALGTGPLVPLIEGGQKQVFRSTLGGTDVVVKVVPVPVTTFVTDVVERARREVEVLSIVDSPFIVRVLSEAVEIGERPEAVCWVEELLDGEDLTLLMTTAGWTTDDIWQLIGDVGRGLAACHELDVVHRDLSLGNVRRRASGQFVLMDPGVARHLTKTAITGLYNPGTFGYMTPEHVPGGLAIPASDVFGVGILAYYALTGALPVRYVGNDDEYFRLLRTADAPSAKVLAPDAPDELVAVIDRCLRRQPARRYLDASELLADLPEVTS